MASDKAAYYRAWAALNKERLKEYQRKYHEERREEHNTRDRAYRDAHREELNANARRYGQEHREQVLASHRLYYQAHVEEFAAYGKAFRAANPGVKSQRDKEYRMAYPDRIRERRLKKFYGLTLAEYQAMLLAQKGCCAICGQPETAVDGRTGTPRQLAVDHDHETGQVRGLLCGSCNLALGGFRHSQELLISASRYLDNYSAVVVPESAIETAVREA